MGYSNRISNIISNIYKIYTDEYNEITEKSILLNIIKANGNCNTIYIPGMIASCVCSNCFIRKRCKFIRFLVSTYIILSMSRKYNDVVEIHSMMWDSIHELLYKKALNKFIKKYGKVELCEEYL